MATAWSPPNVGEAAFGAYVLYRNFDGNGGHFETTYARTTVTGSGVAAFGAVGPTRATVALANENGSATTVQITLGNFQPAATASVYALGTGSSIVKQPDVTLVGGAISVTLPATSIAMVVVNAGATPDAGMGTTGGTASTTGTTGSTTGGSGTSSGGSTGSGTSGGTGGSAGNGTNGSSTGGKVSGGGCSSAPGGGADLAPPLLALLLLLWRRNRLPARISVCSSCAGEARRRRPGG